MAFTSLNEITEDIENLTPEKLHGFIRSMTDSLLDLKDSLHSNDPKEREAAVLAAIELKSNLEKEMETLVKKTGIDPAQFKDVEKTDLDPSYGFVQEEIEKLDGLFAAPQPSRAKKTNFNRK